MAKIKTVIINDNKKTINIIKENLKEIEYVEVIGEGTPKGNGDALKMIVDLKPNAVFTKFKMKNINALELMVESSFILGKETPIFKYVLEDIKGKEKTANYKVKSKKRENENYVSVKELNIEGIKNTLKKYHEEFA